MNTSRLILVWVVRYDGTNFQLMSPAGNASATTIGWAISAGTCTSLDVSATAQVH